MATGMRTRYTDTGIARHSIADVIKMIDWTEAPLVHLLGLNNEKKFRLQNFPNTKYEWIEDSMSPRADQLAEALDNSETGVDVDDGTVFKTGDIIQVDSELMYVASVSSNTLTVTRGFAGTTAASHDDDSAVYIRTIAQIEGADAVTGHTTVTSQPYNYSQIIHEAVKVSKTQQAISDYGISDTLGYHVAKLIGGGTGIGSKGKAGKLVIQLANTFHYGYRAQGGATSSRAMGGAKQFISSNVTAKAGDAVERNDILDMMQTIHEAGGSPDTIITGAWGLRKITQFFEGFISTERSESRGGSKITTIVTDFGDLSVEYDRWCPTNRMYVVEKDLMGWVQIRPFMTDPLPSTGDYDWVNIVGEYGFVLQNEASHGYIDGFATDR